MGLGDLITEARSAETQDLDVRTTQELVELMNREDSTVPAAVGVQATQIAAAVDAIVERLQRGGRLIYAGAGTSGWLAAMDARECESTFSSDPGQVVALVAGGRTASVKEQAVAEDDAEAGRRDV